MPRPFNCFFAITPSDTVDLDYLKTERHEGIYVGAAGAVVAVMPSGQTVTFAAVPAGTVLDITVRRINATSTVASGLVGLRQV